MSRKHNTKHPGRARSRYPQRLEARGLGKAPMLAEIEGTQGLRARQERRVEQGREPWAYINYVSREESAA